jgi:hemerythrin-like domain-containing protein
MTDEAPTALDDALRSDHRAITALLDALTGDADQGDDAVAEEFVTEVVRHLVAEEQYLFPAVRDELDDGEAEAERGFAEHREIEKLLRSCEHADDPAERAALAKLQTVLRAHITHQETDLLPRLAAKLTSEQLAVLGEGVLGAEQLAPTRPRLVAPESPALNKLSSLVEGYVDKVRDYYSGRGVAD